MDKVKEVDEVAWEEEDLAQQENVYVLRVAHECPIKGGLHATREHALNAGRT